MSNVLDTGLDRRAVMAVALGAMVPAGLALTPPDLGALAGLRQQFGLESLADALLSRLAANAELSAIVQAFAQTGAGRIEECIGGELATAAHSLPSLVMEDCLAGRVLDVGGLSFTPTELALLLA